MAVNMNSPIMMMVDSELPPGFRFYPSDEELIIRYLSKKEKCDNSNIWSLEDELNRVEPWDLPVEQHVRDIEWYLYSPRDRKHAIGQRNNRATEPGYWRATGKGRHVHRKEVPHRNEKNACVLPRKGSRWHHHSCKILR